MAMGDPLLITEPDTCMACSSLAAPVAAARISLGDFDATPLPEPLDELDEPDELPPHAEIAQMQITATVDRASRMRTATRSVVAAPARTPRRGDGRRV